MFTSATQLKDWIKNKSRQTGAHANILLQNYMMERFLERVSVSPYRENMILKGGFLVAAMVGIDRRSTMDLDATVKGLTVSREEIEKIILDIVAIDVRDRVTFEIQDIKNIHDISEYDDFRVSIRALLYTVRVDMKIDFTTGDIIIPREIEYPYRLMFEDRTIPVMAYNLYTILAEKIETILVRGVGSTRGRDYYDVYLLLSTNKDRLSRAELFQAFAAKADDRGSSSVIVQQSEILDGIAVSPDIAKIWDGYKRRYSYAKGIALADIIALIRWGLQADA